MPFSIFDVFRIGIGPSSSHTVGPMLAVNRYLRALRPQLARVARVRVDLYGSLALTGVGHCTDSAVLLGLLGEEPHLVDPALAQQRVARVRAEGRLPLAGAHEVPFDEAADLLFHKRASLPQHPNGMRVTAFDASGAVLLAREYFSIGGGAVKDEDEIRPALRPAAAQDGADAQEAHAGPCPFVSAAELLAWCQRQRCSIAEAVLRNEASYHGAADARARVLEIWHVMRDCVERGLHTEGVLPGGLNLKRRASSLYRQARDGANGRLSADFAMMDILSAYAIAVNEENAAGGRVVTAPTNGSAGVDTGGADVLHRRPPAGRRGRRPDVPADGGRHRHAVQAQCVDFRSGNGVPGRDRRVGLDGGGRPGGGDGRHPGAGRKRGGDRDGALSSA